MMRKPVAGVLVAGVVLLIAAIVAFIFHSRPRPTGILAPALLPADTVALFHLPDLRRTSERWPDTALGKISREPEVAAFLERPLRRLLGRHEAEVWRRLGQVRRIDPGEVFLAVAQWPETGSPRLSGGFSYRGNREEINALIAEARGALQQRWPAGRSDLIKVGNAEVETFTYTDRTFAWTFHGDWLLAANDLELLTATVARLAKAPAENGGTLRQNPVYGAALQKMPADADMVSFVQTERIADRLISFLAMANAARAGGGTGDMSQLELLRKVKALAAATKLDGENLRDALFVLASEEKKQPPLPRASLGITSPDTLAYWASLIEKPAYFRWPSHGASANASTPGPIQSLQSMLQTLSAGVTSDSFWAIFGPEIGLVTDWPAEANTPAPVLALQVRKVADARRLLETIAQIPVGGPGTVWTRQSLNGADYFQCRLPSTPMGQLFNTPPIEVTMALTERLLLAGFSFDTVKKSVERAKTDSRELLRRGSFRNAAETVREPTAAFAFVESRPLFERIYGPLREFVKMWALLASNITTYIDPSKLPGTETVSQHLGPIVYSQTSVDGGTLSESAGPVTISQATFVLGGIGVSAAVANAGKGVLRGLVPTAPTPRPMPAPLPLSPSAPLPSVSLTSDPSPVTSVTPSPVPEASVPPSPAPFVSPVPESF